MKKLAPFFIMISLCLAQENNRVELPRHGDSLYTMFDTLAVTKVHTEIKVQKKWFFTGVGIMVLSGASAWIYHEEAEKAFNRYLREGDASKIDGHYNAARKNDKYAAAAYVGFQVGFLMVLKAFFP